MKGDIISAPNRTSSAYGGGNSYVVYRNMIVAVKGDIDSLSTNSTSTRVFGVCDYSFGMTTSTPESGVTNTTLSDFTYHSKFGDLPYVPFVKTDTMGTTHNWEFVFPNVSGKPAYSEYSHVTISSANTVQVPVRIEFDFSETNTTEYATYYTNDSVAYVDDSLGVLDSDASAVYDYTGTNQKFPAPIQIIMYAIMADVIWTPIPGASWYRVTYIEDAGDEMELILMTTDNQVILHDVKPESSYEVRLYTDLDPLTPARSVSGESPLVNTASVKDVMDRIGNDLSILPDKSTRLVEEEVPSTLPTGTKIKTPKGDVAKVVRNSGNVTVPKPGVALLTEFSDSAGSDQSFTVTLPDASSSEISYDNTNDTILSNSEEYAIGEYFILGDFKVYVKNLVE